MAQQPVDDAAEAEQAKNFPSYCKTITVRDSHGTVKELIFPKALDLDRPKRARTTFSNQQLDRLESEFKVNQYLVGKDRSSLAHRLGLSETQVKVWFQNRRTKHKKDKERHEECVDSSAESKAAQNVLKMLEMKTAVGYTGFNSPAHGSAGYPSLTTSNTWTQDYSEASHSSTRFSSTTSKHLFSKKNSTVQINNFHGVPCYDSPLLSRNIPKCSREDSDGKGLNCCEGDLGQDDEGNGLRKENKDGRTVLSDMSKREGSVDAVPSRVSSNQGKKVLQRDLDDGQSSRITISESHCATIDSSACLQQRDHEQHHFQMQQEQHQQQQRQDEQVWDTEDGASESLKEVVWLGQGSKGHNSAFDTSSHHNRLYSQGPLSSHLHQSPVNGGLNIINNFQTYNSFAGSPMDGFAFGTADSRILPRFQHSVMKPSQSTSESSHCSQFLHRRPTDNIRVFHDDGFNLGNQHIMVGGLAGVHASVPVDCLHTGITPRMPAPSVRGHPHGNAFVAASDYTAHPLNALWQTQYRHLTPGYHDPFPQHHSLFTL